MTKETGFFMFKSMAEKAAAAVGGIVVPLQNGRGEVKAWAVQVTV